MMPNTYTSEPGDGVRGRRGRRAISQRPSSSAIAHAGRSPRLNSRPVSDARSRSNGGSAAPAVPNGSPSGVNSARSARVRSCSRSSAAWCASRDSCAAGSAG